MTNHWLEHLKTWGSQFELRLLTLIILLGFILRFYGVGFGLPHLYHADEPIVMNHALAYGSGDFHPHFFKIPPLISYLLFFCLGIYFLLGKMTGVFFGVEDFELLFYSNPTSFYLIGRVVFGVLLGTMAIFFYYRLIASYFSVKRALIGSFLLAVCFIHVRQSHYLYVDIALFLVMILTFQPIFEIALGNEKVKKHICVGAFIGLATAIKYNGVFLAVPYLYATLCSPNKKEVWKSWFLSGIVCCVVYGLLNPFSILDFPFFINEIMAEAKAHLGVAWSHHLIYSLKESLGVPLLCFSILGMIFAWFSGSVVRRVWIVFFISYYVVICRMGQPYPRYILPLLIPCLFFAADLIISFAKRLKQYRLVTPLGLLVFLSTPTFLQSVAFSQIMQKPDVRTLSQNFIERNIDAGDKMALDINFYMPRLRFSVDQLQQKKRALEKTGDDAGAKMRRLEFFMKEAKEKPSYDLFELSDEWKQPEGLFSMSKPRLPFDYEVLKKERIDYVIVSQMFENDKHLDFYQTLEEKATLIAEFNPYRNKLRRWPYTHPLTGGPFLFKDLWERERNGQPIKIYRLRSKKA